jgi:hypothetical protein
MTTNVLIKNLGPADIKLTAISIECDVDEGTLKPQQEKVVTVYDIKDIQIHEIVRLKE